MDAKDVIEHGEEKLFGIRASELCLVLTWRHWFVACFLIIPSVLQIA